MGHFFAHQLAAAVERGEVPMSRLDDMCRRIVAPALTLETPEATAGSGQAGPPLDVERSLAAAETIACRSMVVLSNDGVLPLDPEQPRSLLLVGANADRAVLSGAGSAAVHPRGGDPVNPPDLPYNAFSRVTWVPSSPLDALRQALPRWQVEYVAADDLEAVLGAARDADIVVVMATQHTSEGRDMPDLHLPDEQDALIDAVVEVNNDVLVVLQTGGPVYTPWARRVRAVVEAWYPGHRGGEALASVLTGIVNPSAKLPVTFPADPSQLVRSGPPAVPMKPGRTRPDRVPPHGDFSWVDLPFQVEYDEPVGYQRYDVRALTPAFPFGHGLSYTSFDYAGLTVGVTDDQLTVRFEVTNTGQRDGTEIGQVYAGLPSSLDEPPLRLVGWAVLPTTAGSTEQAEVVIPVKRVATWDIELHRWVITPGRYTLRVGRSSRDLPLSVEIDLEAAALPTLAEARHVQA